MKCQREKDYAPSQFIKDAFNYDCHRCKASWGVGGMFDEAWRPSKCPDHVCDSECYYLGDDDKIHRGHKVKVPT